MTTRSWEFHNLTRNGPSIPIRSIDHAVELFMEASGENDFGVVLEFDCSPKGFMYSIAGAEYGTLSFDPNYDPNAHSTIGTRSARPSEPLIDEDFVFDDGLCASSVPRECVLNILDVVRGVQYILEHHDYPPFLEWRPER